MGFHHRSSTGEPTSPHKGATARHAPEPEPPRKLSPGTHHHADPNQPPHRLPSDPPHFVSVRELYRSSPNSKDAQDARSGEIAGACRLVSRIRRKSWQPVDLGIPAAHGRRLRARG